jgi:hypothetical protein
MDEAIVECTEKRCNIDVLCDEVGLGVYVYGARIRPWSRDGKGRMVLGGSTSGFQAALAAAVVKARAGQWEVLDWSKRPWETRPAVEGW